MKKIMLFIFIVFIFSGCAVRNSLIRSITPDYYAAKKLSGKTLVVVDPAMRTFTAKVRPVSTYNSGMTFYLECGETFTSAALGIITSCYEDVSLCADAALPQPGIFDRVFVFSLQDCVTKLTVVPYMPADKIRVATRLVLAMSELDNKNEATGQIRAFEGKGSYSAMGNVSVIDDLVGSSLHDSMQNAANETAAYLVKNKQLGLKRVEKQTEE